MHKMQPFVINDSGVCRVVSPGCSVYQLSRSRLWDPSDIVLDDGPDPP